MNELAMNFASKRVYDAYLKFLIVSEAAVTNVLCKLFAMDDCFSVSLELQRRHGLSLERHLSSQIKRFA
jgi:hypothetical protein